MKTIKKSVISICACLGYDCNASGRYTCIDTGVCRHNRLCYTDRKQISYPQMWQWYLLCIDAFRGDSKGTYCMCKVFWRLIRL